MPLAKTSHMVKSHINRAGKYTLPVVEGTAKSQEVDPAKSKARYSERAKD